MKLGIDHQTKEKSPGASMLGINAQHQRSPVIQISVDLAVLAQPEHITGDGHVSPGLSSTSNTWTTY
jgi:hypothetical protein